MIPGKSLSVIIIVVLALRIFSFEIIFNLQTNSFDFFKEYVGDELFDCLS